MRARPSSQTTSRKAEAGLIPSTDVEHAPGDIVLIGYGTKETGPWTIGIGLIGDDGEVPGMLYAAAHGENGMFACRVSESDEGLGDKRHIWVARRSHPDSARATSSVVRTMPGRLE